MISKENQVPKPLDMDQVDCSGLCPQLFALAGGKTLQLFPDAALELMKVDFTFEAGTAYQPKLLVAAAANNLFTQGTRHHTAAQIAEFMDARGIELHRNATNIDATLSVCGLAKYAGELFPLLREILEEPLFPQKEFDIYTAQRRQELQSNMCRTRYVARNLFFQALYGAQHPYGQFAMPEDVDRLTLEEVIQFYHRHYGWEYANLMLSGQTSDEVLRQYDEAFASAGDSFVVSASPQPLLTAEALRPAAVRPQRLRLALPGAVQTTIRIGRRLPWCWDDMRHSRFLLLNTLLGGYFGSRLMSNLREAKGLTYGIVSQIVAYRGDILFFISTDVNAKATQQAVDEIYHELRRLQDEPVPPAELAMVKTYLVGDFMRSIDGILERSERWHLQQLSGITEQLTENFKQMMRTVTPAELQQLAQEVLDPEELTRVLVGVV